MLSAQLKTQEERLETHDMAELRRTRTPEDIRSGEWSCKFCEVGMIPVLGVTREWHFRHQRQASECPSHAELEPESERHRLLKRTAGEALKQHYGAQVAALEFEARVKDAGRIADALLTFRNGLRVAVEAQVSPISLENLQKRTHSYTGAEVDVIWTFVAERDGQLKPGSSWATARDWLTEQGYLVVVATLETQVQPLPLPK